jgi:hypothetical protein
VASIVSVCSSRTHNKLMRLDLPSRRSGWIKLAQWNQVYFCTRSLIISIMGEYSPVSLEWACSQQISRIWCSIHSILIQLGWSFVAVRKSSAQLLSSVTSSTSDQCWRVSRFHHWAAPPQTMWQVKHLQIMRCPYLHRTDHAAQDLQTSISSRIAESYKPNIVIPFRDWLIWMFV